MSAKDDGGPAFPLQNAAEWQYGGMSLRDYFAAKVEGLSGDAQPSYGQLFIPDMPQPADGDHLGWAKWWAAAEAAFRYIQADAMLEARK